MAEYFDLSVSQTPANKSNQPVVAQCRALGQSWLASPGQHNLVRYLILKNQPGYKLSPDLKVWMSVRSLSRHMYTLDAANRKIGIQTPMTEFNKASRHMACLLQELCTRVSVQELNHPGFRAELTAHITSMCAWSFTEKKVWRYAHALLQPHEKIIVFGVEYDKLACLAQVKLCLTKKFGLAT